MEKRGSPISVVIPAYNSEATISDCLKALRRQTLAPLEIIVVDDSSKDRTAEVAEKLATVIPNTNRKGSGGARNTGASAAKGDIIAFIDSDCIPPPDWLEKISHAFNEEGVDAVAGGYSGYIGESFMGKFAFLELSRRRQRFPDYVDTAASNNLAVKSESFKRAGGFPESFTGASLEDMVLSFKISRIAKIRWLRENGVRHLFPQTLKSYLHQQYVFGRDTVVVYKTFPEIFTVKTHQGRLIYFETFIAALTLCGLIRPRWFITGICVLMLFNLRLIRDCFKTGGLKMILRAFLLIPVRDFNMVLSVAGGIVKLMTGAAKERIGVRNYG